MILRRFALLPLYFLALSALAAAATFHVATTGKDGAAGTLEAPLADVAEAVARAQPGDVIRVAAGTYKRELTVRLQRSGTADKPIRIEAADTAARPVFDFSAQQFKQAFSGFLLRGDYWHLVGLEVIGAARVGINVSGHHNRIERCVAHENQDSGIQISAPGSHNLVLDCDSYRNVDRPTLGENADGFAAKFAVGPGNVFRGCRAWENADDGFDLWKAPVPVRLENCVAFRNGIDLWDIPGYTGNGNAFKLGGDFIAAAHVVIGCIAMDQPMRGFDQNNNMAGLTLESCTATRCKIGFAFGKTPTTGHHVLRNNISWDAPARVVEGTVLEGNRWAGADGAPIAATITSPTKPGTPTRTP